MSYKSFIVADKFCDTNTIQESNITYLYTIDKEKEDLFEHWMNLLDEKIMYNTLHEIYKKALQIKMNSLRLIKILEDFANEDSEFESEDKSISKKEFNGSDKENINTFQLKNPKIKHC